MKAIKNTTFGGGVSRTNSSFGCTPNKWCQVQGGPEFFVVVVVVDKDNVRVVLNH